VPDIDTFKGFDVSGATVSLWVFKKSTASDKSPVFKGRWVQTTEVLDQALKAAVEAERDRITEIQEYSLLAQPNESSALAITTLETHAGLVVDEVAAELDAKKISRLKDIQNTIFYVIKLVSNDNIMHAVKKTNSTWKAKTARNMISVFFTDNQLTVEEDPGFAISKSVDFFILGENVYIAKKQVFESVLNYKSAHKNDFLALQSETEFSDVFGENSALLSYVGENRIQLRRASAIRQKGHYENPEFMKNIREHHAKYGLNLTFDDEGKIIVSAECCKDIFQALLDHRLMSAFSNAIYDVQNTENVAL
jgi:hypothetical protein